MCQLAASLSIQMRRTHAQLFEEITLSRERSREKMQKYQLATFAPQ